MRLARRLLLALWAGALVALGALVAPALFDALADKAVAGAVAGLLFRRFTIVSLVCAVLLALAAVWLESGGRGRRTAAWALLPGALLALNEFAVRPLLSAARGAGVVLPRAFYVWHGVSTALYACATLLVVVLLVGELRR